MISQWETPSPLFYTDLGKDRRYLNSMRISFLYISSNSPWPIKVIPFASRRARSSVRPITTFFAFISCKLLFYKNVYNFCVCLSITHNWNEFSGWNLLHLVGILHRSVSIEKFFHRLHCVVSGRLSTNSPLEATWNWNFFTKLPPEAYIVCFCT